jgi:5'-methylthioadenosine phosphorylase
MTLIPETFLARELEMCYAALCYATNYAEGVAERPYEAGRLFEGMAGESEKQMIDEAVASFPQIIKRIMVSLSSLSQRGSKCQCGESMLRYKKTGTIGEDWRSWIEKKCAAKRKI